MSNNNTPMQILKYHLDITKNRLNDTFKLLDLNKKSESYNPYGGSHGLGEKTLPVQSDFLFVFNDKNSTSSFAFVFDYLGKDKEDWTVCVSYKPHSEYHWDQTKEEKQALNKNIKNSQIFSVDEFKKIIKDFNKSLEKNVDPQSVYKEIFSRFFDKNMSNEFSKSVEKEASDIKSFIKEKIELANSEKEELKKDEENHKKLVDKIDQEIKNSPEYIRAEELKAELEILNRKILKNKENIEDKHEVKKKALALYKRDLAIKCKDRENRKLIKREIEKRPAQIKSSLRSKFKV